MTLTLLDLFERLRERAADERISEREELSIPQLMWVNDATDREVYNAMRDPKTPGYRPTSFRS